MVDRRKLQVGHGFISGTPGSGVTFCSKQEILNVLHTSEDQVIVIDLYGDYVSLAREIGGRIIDFDLSNQEHSHINLFDAYSKDIQDENIFPTFLDHKWYFFVAFFDCMLGGNFSALQKSIIDQCISVVYKKYMKSFDKKTGEFDKTLIPIFSDFYDELKKQSGFDAYTLTQSLEIYNSGSFDWFSQKTDISFDDKFTVLNFGKVGSEFRSILSLAALELVKIHLVNSMNDTVNIKKKIWLYIDDLNVLLRHDCCVEYLKYLSKIARKNRCILTFVTRHIAEVLKDDRSRHLIMNCDYFQMLNHTPHDSDCLAKCLDIPRKYISFITGKKAGEGLIYAGKSYIPFRLKYNKASNDYEIEQIYIENSEKNNRFVLGSIGKAAKRRSYEASEFKPELVPDYVDTIEIVTDPITKKRYFTYVDTYGCKNTDEI